MKKIFIILLAILWSAVNIYYFVQNQSNGLATSYNLIDLIRAPLEERVEQGEMIDLPFYKMVRKAAEIIPQNSQVILFASDCEYYYYKANYYLYPRLIKCHQDPIEGLFELSADTNLPQYILISGKTDLDKKYQPVYSEEDQSIFKLN